MYARLVTAADALRLSKSDNGPVAARGTRLVASLLRAEPQGPASGWALALDAAVGVGLAAVAVFEVAGRTGKERIVTPDGPFTVIVPEHPARSVVVVAALTALPLAARRIYPIAVWLAIVAAILVLQGETVPPV